MKPDSASSVTYAVRQHGAFLATRALGKTVLRDLEDRLAGVNDNDCLVIDFTGVEAMSISFVDEFLGRYYGTLTTIEQPPTVVLLTGLNEDNRESITVCMQRHDLIVAYADANTVSLLGAPAVLDETYQAASELGTFTATHLAKRLEITAPNANNRLKRLAAARALVRNRGIAHRGGKEFTYTVPTWDCSVASRAGQRYERH